MSGGARPLLYYWAAFYEDETVLPQFDLETGEENLFKAVDLERVVQFGLFPFSPKFAEIVKENGVKVIPSMTFPRYLIRLEKGDELIHLRRNAIQTGITTGGEMKELQREIIYVLGKRRRVGRGWNNFILFINENGNVTVSSDFNYGRPRWSE